MDDKCIVTLSDFYVLDLAKHKKQEANCSLCHLQHATHTVVFSQLSINGRNEGVHAFICQLRDAEGHVCPGIRIADCGHKIGLNGVDNGRIWFDHVRIPRENLLNSVADVTPDGQYESAIKDPDQRFGAFMAPLTSGRVTIAVSAVYQAKLGLATAIRYGLTRRAFSLSPEEPEVLLLDYPSHQHRLLPLLAKTYAMSFAALDLKKLYVRRTPADSKTIHVLSSGLKAMLSWHGIRTLQVGLLFLPSLKCYLPSRYQPYRLIIQCSSVFHMAAILT
jgi:acyl-CoA oxidase